MKTAIETKFREALDLAAKAGEGKAGWTTLVDALNEACDDHAESLRAQLKELHDHIQKTRG